MASGTVRAVESATLQLGMAAVPVNIYTTAKDTTPKTHLAHKTCGTQIKEQKRCPKCQVDLTQDDLVSGVEVSKGHLRLLENDEGKAPTDKSRTIAIEGTLKADQIPDAQRKQVYYLAPEDGGRMAFRLFHDALQDAGLVMVGTRTTRGNTHLVSVGAGPAGTLVMWHLHWAEDMRQPAALPNVLEMAEKEPSKRDLTQTAVLLENLPLQGGLDQFENERKRALKEIVAAEATTTPIKTSEAAQDLVAALQAAVIGRKGRKGAKS